MATSKDDVKRSKDEQLLQQLAYEFESLRQQLAGIDSELQELHNRLSEFDRAKETVDAINRSRKGDEVLIPLSEGLFIKAGIKDENQVLLGVGSGVVIGKGLNDAKDYVQNRINEADNLINRLNNNAEYFLKRMRELEPELQRLTSELRR